MAEIPTRGEFDFLVSLIAVKSFDGIVDFLIAELKRYQEQIKFGAHFSKGANLYGFPSQEEYAVRLSEIERAISILQERRVARVAV